MKDIFDVDSIVEGVKETERVEDTKGWWIGRKCTFCGDDKKLWISANGIVRCEKHYVNREG